MARILAIDYGSKRVGIAVTDILQIIATGLTTVHSKDLISYLKVFYNPKDSISWQRILNTPTRGVGDKTIEKIKEANFDLDLIDSKTKFPFSEI